VTTDHLVRVLGKPKFNNEIYTKGHPPGVAVGLAWTAVGGDILFIEAGLHKGKGTLQLTGNLGDVMKESASTALSYLKAHSTEYGIQPERFEEVNIHIHVPEGAVPKDGPSAGITMLSALASAFTGRKLKPFLAMTGEITLRGRVSAIGGLKEKLLAALRGGIHTVIIPEENRKDLADIPDNVTRDLKIVPVKWIDEVLDLALETPLKANAATAGDAAPVRRKPKPKAASNARVKH
jgi:ATP-dependent Lon protease